MIKYNAKTPLRCFFAFEGYNSQGLALNRLKERYPDFEWVCVGRSEIDRYAITAADSLFPESADKNFGDITRIDWSTVPDFDLFTWSFPCQSLSVAGRQAGMAEGSGTASSLAFECMKAIETKRPKFCVMENVKALTQQKFSNDFNELQRRLMEMGYVNFWQVLNAKNYGVPQNRERVFMVSIRIDSEVPHYEFPRPIPPTKCIADIMETNVDESYYLTDEQLRAVLAHCDRKVAEGCGFKAQITPPPLRKRLNNNEIRQSANRPVIKDSPIIVGRVNSSQDGIVVSPCGISPTHVCGHCNCPKILVNAN